MSKTGDMAGAALKEVIPEPPKFSDEEMKRCRDTGDYKPVMFEWYKFVGSLCVIVANIRPDCPVYRRIPPQHYYVLVGLLNRCARLMLSNIALSHQGKFGETTVIVDRCIFESAVRIIWLSHSASQEEFTRYLADSLRPELEFRDRIEADIAEDGGVASRLQTRMLKSIDRHIAASGLTPDELKTAKKQRDLAAMMDALGFDRLHYIAAQRLGSHHVHGTWSSLLIHYLEQSADVDGFAFFPSPGPDDTHINQYLFIPVIVLHAMGPFVCYALTEPEANVLSGLFESIEQEIMRIYTEAGEDAN